MMISNTWLLASITALSTLRTHADVNVATYKGFSGKEIAILEGVTHTIVSSKFFAIRILILLKLQRTMSVRSSSEPHTMWDSL